jgi:hypothetical protein
MPTAIPSPKARVSSLNLATPIALAAQTHLTAATGTETPPSTEASTAPAALTAPLTAPLTASGRAPAGSVLH